MFDESNFSVDKVISAVLPCLGRISGLDGMEDA